MTKNQYSPPPAYVLSEQDKDRLEHLAVQFSVPMSRLSAGRIRLTVPSQKGPVTLDLPSERGYLRLLMELCSITAKWLYFRQEEHCAVTLLSQADARLDRLAHLYHLWVAEGCQDQSVTQLPATSRARRLA